MACAAGIRGQVLLEQRASEVHDVRQMFDALRDSALTPDESAQLIAAAARKL